MMKYLENKVKAESGLYRIVKDDKTNFLINEAIQMGRISDEELLEIEKKAGEKAARALAKAKLSKKEITFSLKCFKAIEEKRLLMNKLGIKSQINKQVEEEIYLAFLKIYDYILENDVYTFGKYWLDMKNRALIGYSTFRTYSSNNEFCKDIRSRIDAILEARIVDDSLKKKIDGNFAKYLLANKNGWKEKSEQDISLVDKRIRFDFGQIEDITPEQDQID